MALTVGSLFAGIGGFDLGFERAGFSVRWQIEQDGKAQSVLSHRFAGAKLYDDVRTVGAANLESVDVICGGFPCQDVSVAGKREGLSGERTGLFSEVVRIAREMSPRWMVLENVPGLLSSHRGRDFHTVLVALAECGFRRAYRILDSRYFGVAQRRRRVFLVLRARGGGDGPETVLFEQPSGGGDSQTGDEARADVAATLRGRSHGAGVNAPGRGGEDDQNLVAACLTANYGKQIDSSDRNGGPPNLITFDNRWGVENANAPTLRADCHGSQPMIAMGVHANQRGELRTSGLAGSLNGSRSGKQFEGVAHCLTGTMHKRHDEDTDTLIATSLSASMGHHGHSSPRGDGSDNLIADTLLAPTGGQRATDLSGNYQVAQLGVRRLTPLECERLQGFPDGWTCLCGAGWQGSSFCECADSPRYRQLGNAVTVNVAHWIARRIIEAETQLRSFDAVTQGS